MYHIYPLNQDPSCKPDKIIVEATNSGYEYFKAISKEKNIVDVYKRQSVSSLVTSHLMNCIMDCIKVILLSTFGKVSLCLLYTSRCV